MTTKKKEQIDWRIVIAGIAALTLLEIVALLKGINGTLLSIVIAMIGLVIGITIPLPKVLKAFNIERYVGIDNNLD